MTSSSPLLFTDQKQARDQRDLSHVPAQDTGRAWSRLPLHAATPPTPCARSSPRWKRGRHADLDTDRPGTNSEKCQHQFLMRTHRHQNHRGRKPGTFPTRNKIRSLLQHSEISWAPEGPTRSLKIPQFHAWGSVTVTVFSGLLLRSFASEAARLSQVHHFNLFKTIYRF